MPSWTPAQIATSLWLDASDSATLFDAVSGGSLVAIDGAVARWQDKSGNLRHVTQSTAGTRAARKASVQNGLDAMLFDGNDWYQNTSSSPLPNNAKTIVAVVKSSNATGGEFFNNLRATAAPTRFLARLLRISSVNYVAGDSTTVNVTTTYNFSTEFQSAFLASWTETSARATNFWSNGTSRATTGTVAAESSTTGFRIGSLLGGDGITYVPWPGHIMEIVCVDAEVSTGVRQQIEGYLAHKWGTVSALDGSHPYKSAAPTYGDSPRRRTAQASIRSTF